MIARLIVDHQETYRYGVEEVLNTIILGNALKVLPKLPDEMVDMAFIDPPYFLQLPQKRLLRWKVKTVVEGVNEDWDKFASFEDYDQFIIAILKEVKRVMKAQATIWCIGTYHNIHRIGKLMQDLGFWILNDVIWIKTNPMPNWLNVRFTNATETLIWAVKDKNVKGYTFNVEIARKFSEGKLALNVWELPICTGEERIKDEQGKKLHPTQKPKALLERVILVSTKEGNVVLDPLAGTGTTGVVAKSLNRHFVMIEMRQDYVEACLRRFNQETITLSLMSLDY
ncbi:MAG: site-specific DNA-methyltransferase [Candidatus Bathyarchaeia archaeon]